MRKITFADAMTEALDEEMARDDKVFILGEDIQGDSITRGLFKKYGADRIMDTPLSEIAIAGSAVGAAIAGYRPIASIMFADFMWCCADEIFNKAAKWHFVHGGKVNVPVVFFAGMGGYSGGGPEHSQCLEAVVMHTPGLKLALPSNAYDAKGLLKTAIRDNNPVVYFFHRKLLGEIGEVPDEEYTVPFGKAEIKKHGKDVTLIATSYMVKMALDVANEFARNVSIEVIDPRCLEPLDIDTILASARKTGRVVIVDEDTLRCGVGAEIGMQIMERAFSFLKMPVQRVAAANLPIAGASLEQYVLPQPKDVISAIEAVIK